MKNHKQQSLQKGATLLEVLIATVVISIGLLSLASLQVVSTKGNQTAYFQSQATVLAMDLSERIRSMPSSANTFTRAAQAAAPACANLPLANNDRINSPATDNTQWLNLLACTLPASNATVTIAGGQLRINIRWSDGKELDNQNNPVVYNFNYVTQL